MAEAFNNIKEKVVGGLQVRPAIAGDVDMVWGVINECAQWLAGQGLTHWANHYTREMMAKMIAHHEVYLALRDGELVSTMTFSKRPPKYYVTENYVQRFTEPEESAAYVMAIGVLPQHQKQGIAGSMVQLAEDLARLRGVKWLRLDCRSEVPGLVSFYEKRGFNKTPNGLCVEGEGESYWLMEKRIGV